MKQWCFAVLLLTTAWTGRGATYYVATNGLDTRTGLDDWTNAVATISNAVFKAAASEGNLVLVSNGTYTLSATISITNGSILRSFKDDAVARDSTIIDGNGACRCFSIAHGNAVLDGFTVNNGYAAHGGGILLDRGGAVTNCLIAGNLVIPSSSYSGGGGIYVWTGSVFNCTISGNLVTNGSGSSCGGGGVYIRGRSLLRDCTISNNFSSTNYSYTAGGGGVYIFYTDAIGTCIVERCTIVNNLSSNVVPEGSSGGGMLVWNTSGGQILVTNCTISGNIPPFLRS